MGYMATVTVLMDHVHEIRDDEKFGKYLYHAIVQHGRPPNLQRTYLRGAEVIGVHHADDVHAYIVGGNMGRDLGYVTNWTQSDNDEAILRALADKLGYHIRKKPQRKP